MPGLLLTNTEKEIALEAVNTAIAPKTDVLDRIDTTDGAHTSLITYGGQFRGLLAEASKIQIRFERTASAFGGNGSPSNNLSCQCPVRLHPQPAAQTQDAKNHKINFQNQYVV